MDYESMTDFQVNKAVAEALGHKVTERITSNQLNHVYTLDNSNAVMPSYCNNPSDAWPIITDNGIDIFHGMNRGIASDNVSAYITYTGDLDDGYVIWAADENILRAAMICFLKMQETQ